MKEWPSLVLSSTPPSELTRERADLSAQELGTLRLAAQGLSNSRIGRELGRSEKTVRNTFTRIYCKLDLRTDRDINPRVAAINMARDMGLLAG